MDYADILKWLMIGTVAPLITAVALFFIGAYVSEAFWIPVGALYVIGRGFFILWCAALLIALYDYYRKHRGVKREANT